MVISHRAYTSAFKCLSPVYFKFSLYSFDLLLSMVSPLSLSLDYKPLLLFTKKKRNKPNKFPILPYFQVKYIWTSGRLCDFKGCERPDLQPTNINGWFWTATLQKLAPTSERSQGDWSPSGGIGLPQPDNREYKQNGAPENCLALLNQFYNDGVNWHDVACHHKKPFVCEENDALLKYVRYTNPQLRI